MNHVQSLIKYAQKLDSVGRSDLADSIDNHISEINFINSLPVASRKKLSHLISPDNNKGCASCGKTAQDKNSLYEDWTENSDIKDIHQNHLRSIQDLEDTELHHSMYKDLDGSSSSSGELLKSLLEEWDAYKELFMEIIMEDENNDVSAKNLSIISDRLTQINEEINEIHSKL